MCGTPIGMPWNPSTSSAPRRLLTRRDRAGESLPLVVRLRAGQHQEGLPRAVPYLVNGDLRGVVGLPVILVVGHRRAAGPVVDQPVDVERRDRLVIQAAQQMRGEQPPRRASVDESVQVVQQDSLVKLRRTRVDLVEVPPIRHHAHSLPRVGLVTDNNRRAPVFHPASPCANGTRGVAVLRAGLRGDRRQRPGGAHRLLQRVDVVGPVVPLAVDEERRRSGDRTEVGRVDILGDTRGVGMIAQITDETLGVEAAVRSRNGSGRPGWSASWWRSSVSCISQNVSWAAAASAASAASWACGWTSVSGRCRHT